MNFLNEVPAKGKRVLMLTPDIIIDRRILIEAETLIDDGYEVYLLAGAHASCTNLYEIDGRVKIQRIKFEGIDERTRYLLNIQSIIINFINGALNGLNQRIGTVSQMGTHTINSCIIKKTALMNGYSLSIQERLGRTSGKTGLWIRFLKFSLLATLKTVYLSSHYCDVLFKSFLKIYLFFIHGAGRICSFLLVSLAKMVNLIVRILLSFFQKMVDLTAYEYVYFNCGVFYRPDIVHVHDFPMLKSGVAIKKLLHVPLIYDMHEFYPEQAVLTPHQKSQMKKTEQKNIPSCDALITVNPFLAKEISHTYGDVDIHIIQNSVIIPDHFHDRKYNKFRDEYGIREDELIVLYQGWISPNRNLHNLISALSFISKPIKLIIMGYGEYQSDLELLAKEQGVQDKVIFVPAKNQKDLLSYTASADLGIIPYPFSLDPNTKYASPNKLYEFIAAYLPILSNDLPFVKSVIVEYGFGSVAKMDSPAGIAEALNNFSYEQLSIFRTNLIQYGNKFLWNAEAPVLLKIYSSLPTK